jgi:CubicO group peptidase (beta-lactamase class C family)
MGPQMKKLNILLLSALLQFPLSSSAQLPSIGGHASVPDSWLLGNGSKWHHQTAKSDTPAQLIFRQPTLAERPIVEKAMRIFENSSAKSMALLDGNNVVWVGYKEPAKERSRFLSMSIGKTVASMAVGKAICAGKFSLNSVTQDIIPELKETDLGKATVRDLLMMASGTWEGNSDSTIYTNKQISEMDSGQLSTLDVLKTAQVSSAHKGFLGTKRKSGEEFAYRSTDPLTLGVIINKTTGATYAKWVEQEVLLPAGIEVSGVIGQDKFNYGASAGNVRLTLNDWMRFAIWVKQNEAAQGCFGNYVRESSKTQIANSSKRSGKLFDGYGYLTWTENARLKDSYWAVGHGGQRIGWNQKNNRILIAFSNIENYMDDLYWLYRDWAEIKE